MNRFFRSALFPLIIIAALVWLALQTLGNHNTKVEKQTTSYVYNLVRDNPATIDGPVKINPSKQELDAHPDRTGRRSSSTTRRRSRRRRSSRRC